MKRTYLALAGLALAGSTLAGAFPLLARAAALFATEPLDPSRFSVLARPVGDSDWNLVVLEQLAAKPRCWEERADGLIDPALTRFDFSAICARYIDSNGYSLRINDEDLATSYRLRVRQVGHELQLEATSSEEPTVLVVGRGDIPKRERDAFVALQLESGWELLRRRYGEQTLQHLYFSNDNPLGELLAEAGNEGAVDSQEDLRDDDDLLAQSPSSAEPSELNADEKATATAARSPLSAVEEQRLATLAAETSLTISSSRPIPLKVIPFQE